MAEKVEVIEEKASGTITLLQHELDAMLKEHLERGYREGLRDGFNSEKVKTEVPSTNKFKSTMRAIGNYLQ